MKILLSNDDGIRAPGIQALYHALTDTDGTLGGPLGELVFPVAPLTVQSATSHGVTFNTPLMTSDETIDDHMHGVAVDGRPADCVKLALSTIWPAQFGERALPDLVISGMNAGANCGINVIYSGTVAAALEAAFLGVPSIAVSLHIGRGKPDWDRAAAIARRVIDRLVAGGVGPGMPLGPHTCLNVNIPVCDDQTEPPTPEDPEVVVCGMNTHGLIDAYERRRTPYGQDYYWAVGDGLDFHAADPGTDVELMFERKVTVTPLKYDLTAHEQLARWRGELARSAGGVS